MIRSVQIERTADWEWYFLWWTRYFPALRVPGKLRTEVHVLLGWWKITAIIHREVDK